MKLRPFKLEEYLAKYEFNSKYLLCCSDAESFSMQEIVSMGSKEEQALWSNLQLGYTPVEGHPLLRHEIASGLYTNIKSENILCFAGAEEGIYATLSTLCNPSDHIIVLTPCYQSLLEIPLMKGAHVTEVCLREENEWRIDLDDIRNLITPQTKGIVLNFPHNPTGQVLTPSETSELVELCEAHGLWVFSDEVYRLLGHPKDGWSKPLATTYPKAISLGVMSKSFGMAGLRIGWIACQDEALLAQIQKMKDYLSICNSAPAEIISLIALRNKEKILDRNNQIVAHNLGLLDSFFETYKDRFSWIRPQGGCVGFVKYKSRDDVHDFTENLHQESGVLLMPGSIYDHAGNYFRIGFGRKNMPEALQELEAFISQ